MLIVLLGITPLSRVIADILKNSDIVIDKARYRLCKKLALETDRDLHAYLLGLG